MNIKEHLRKNTIFYILFFIFNAVEMIMETSASRLLSPVLGATNAVWIAIIGVILLSSCIGNYFGGKLSEKYNADTLLYIVTAAASVFILLIPLMADMIAESVRAVFYNIEISAIISSAFLFFIPTALLSFTTPLLMKEMLEEEKKAGYITGLIHADIALGSLFGAFIGGFVLIPSFGADIILYILSGVVMICSFIAGNRKKRNILISTGLVIVAGILIFLNTFSNNPDRILNLDFKGSVYIDTEYGRTELTNSTYNGYPVRWYKTSGCYSSGTYLDEDKKYDLIMNYFTKLDSLIPYEDVENTLVIGGAAYVYPRYYISTFPDKTMDVVEIDPKSTEIAKKYFFLQDLIEEYGLKETGKLGLYNDDARIFVNETEKKYDVIINDAFSGGNAIATLATKEALECYRKCLNAGGIYYANILASLNGKSSRWLRSEYATAKEVFPYVYLVKAEEGDDSKYINYILICSDHAMDIEGDVKIVSDKTEMVLTDDFCPVDEMVGNSYLES